MRLLFAMILAASVLTSVAAASLCLWRLPERPLVQGFSVHGPLYFRASDRYEVTVSRASALGLTRFEADLQNRPSNATPVSVPEEMVPEAVRAGVFPWGVHRPVPDPRKALDGEDSESCYHAGAFLAGWPARCAWCEWDPPENGRVGAGAWSLTIPGRPHTDTLVIPYRPLWSGLALNAALFAAIWTSLLLASRAGLGALRRRRGRCPRCGSDLKHDLAAGCPECGQGRAAHAE